MDKGYVHVYTGNGKGKTTAAFGLALRAACSGKRVFIGQFVKDMKYSETAVTEKFENIIIEQLGNGCFIAEPPKDTDRLAALEGLKRVEEILISGDCQVVILDEIFIAIFYGLLTDEQVLEAIQLRSESVEVILTGRYAPEKILAYADLVTDMQEIKHYYTQGVLSRKGIDC